MKQPGFISQILEDLEKVPATVRSSINSPGGLHESSLLRLLTRPHDDRIVVFSPPVDGVVGFYHETLEEHTELGSKVLVDEKVAFCIDATSSDIDGKTLDGLVRIPDLNMSLITLKLFQAVGTGPIWIVVPSSHISAVSAHIASQIGIDIGRITIIEQKETYKITPDNKLLFDGSLPCTSGGGSGGLLTSLSMCPQYEQFKARGGKHVFAVNVTNAFAFLDPIVIGHHIKSGKKVTCEVTRRKPNEVGSVLAESTTGVRAVDIRRIDVDNADEYSWLCTDSYVFDTSVELCNVHSDWCRIQTDRNGSVEVHYQKFFDDITASYETNFLGTSRHERFMRLASQADLAAAQQIVSINL